VLIVVTGVPGAGKTTLGTALALALRVPFLSLDSIKEHLYSSDDTAGAYELRMAAEAQLGSRLSELGGGAVVDIWIAPQRDTERVSSLLLAPGADVIEVLCRVPADVAVRRYVGRPRSGPHRPADPATLQRIRAAVEQIEPLCIGRCIEVDTSSPVDLVELAEQLRGWSRADGTGSGER
jgi:predicted kinase